MDPSSPAYGAWLRGAGILLHPHVHLCVEASRGAFALAAAPLRAGELLLSVPAAAALDLGAGGGAVVSSLPPLSAAAAEEWRRPLL